MFKSERRNENLAIGFGLGLIGVLVLTFILMKPSDKEMDLNNLIDVTYNVLEVKSYPSSNQYEVSVSGTFTEAQRIELTTKMYQAIVSNEKNKIETLTVQVHDTLTTLMDEKEDGIAKSFNYALVMNSQTIEQYHTVYIPNVEGDVLASQNWVIEDAYFDITYDLNFKALIMQSLNERDILAQLKGLADEMVRINVPSGETSVVTIKSNRGSDEIYYVSEYEDYIIEKQVLENNVSKLLTKTRLSELFKPFTAYAIDHEDESELEGEFDSYVGIQGDFVSLNDIMDVFDGTVEMIKDEVKEYIFDILDFEIVVTEGIGYTKINDQLEPLFLEISPLDENVKQLVWAIPTIIKDEVLVPIHYIERIFNLQYDEGRFLSCSKVLMEGIDFEFQLNNEEVTVPSIVEKPVESTPKPTPKPDTDDLEEPDQDIDKEEDEDIVPEPEEKPDVLPEEKPDIDGEEENTEQEPVLDDDRLEEEETESPSA